uniref:Uncharacterized protein n=1 Tax=Myoviridae sp. ctCo31 TaxID=2825053 RepID=A0A8S5UME7_9CAUD|nr:MAG TPA: hypothetical protein [Myoviridae sp. ctCo31]
MFLLFLLRLLLKYSSFYYPIKIKRNVATYEL